MSYPIVTTLEPGDAGTDATLRAMRGMAHTSALPPWVPSRPDDIAPWLREHVRFRADPPDRELVLSPSALLDQIRRRGYAEGDCDDLAVLGAALGLRAGMRARFRVVGFSRDGPFAHVWTELEDPLTGSVIDLDIFRPDRPPRVRREAIVDL